jgi:surfeit locus 1 family protein
MPIRFLLKGRVFEASWLMTLGLGVLLAAFLWLGRWQWSRGVATQALWDSFARGADPPAALGSREFGVLPRFTHLRLTGHYDPRHQFLLDNRSLAGRAGYEALTPFTLEDGRTLLVDRGWLPFAGFRAELPDLRFDPPAGMITVTGRLDLLPERGLATGHAAPAMAGPWPRLTSWPSTAELAAALGTPLAPRLLLLDADQADGFTRQWQPPGLAPGRHLSYALQWWLFAAIALGLYGLLNLRPRAS